MILSLMAPPWLTISDIHPLGHGGMSAGMLSPLSHCNSGAPSHNLEAAASVGMAVRMAAGVQYRTKLEEEEDAVSLVIGWN